MKLVNAILNFFREAIPIFFIVLWAASAVSKLTGYTKFRFEIGRSPYLENFADFISIIIPLSELVIALLLVFKATRMMAMYASFFLMVLFTGYIYMMLNFSYYKSCSCGGILALFGFEDNWNDHLIFNFLVTILSIFCILWLGYTKRKEQIIDYNQLETQLT